MRQVARKGILTAVATGSVLASTAGYAYAAADAEGAAANSPGVASGNTVSVPVEAPVNVCGNTVDVVGLLNPAYGNQCGNSSHGGGHHGGAHGGSNGGDTGGANGGSGAGGGGSSAGGTENGPGSTGGTENGPGGSGDHRGSGDHDHGPTAGSSASGVSQGSPGVASGNTGQAPVDVPVNACGDTIDVIGALNPAMGNDCANHGPVVAPPPAPTPPGCSPGENSPTCPPGPPVAPPVVQSGGGTRTAVQPVAAQAPAAQAPQTHLASTGVEGLGIVAPVGLALLIGGGVLYRRARSAA
ncbi:chaplin [Kitasatospora sp. NPDC058965]|uniref:chaplin n=1 Tax=Kitasatospora sp. NPDC058965 TaxID=3346682 RepID=UPI0036B7B96E